MGRKIPGRKHRGVKDPEKQAAVKLLSIKDKINAPPTNPDFQEVSKTLQRVIDLKNKVKTGEFGIKKKKKTNTLQEFNKNKKENVQEPGFQQLPNESDKAFLNRVNIICQNVTKEAAFEDKYGVKIKRNELGEVKEVVKRPKDELEILLKKVKKEKKEKKIKKKKKKGVENEGPRLTKSQKWERKKKEKKLKKKTKNSNDFEKFKDPVKFDEIVHAPPTLTAPKKVQKLPPRPGQKQLLLSAMLPQEHKKPKEQVTKEKLSGVSKKVIDKKAKRKDLPNALRRQLDRQQKEVIGAYKLLKTKKYSST